MEPQGAAYLQSANSVNDIHDPIQNYLEILKDPLYIQRKLEEKNLKNLYNSQTAEAHPAAELRGNSNKINF